MTGDTPVPELRLHPRPANYLGKDSDMALVPENASMVEYMVTNATLRNIRQEILSGRPSGLVIDQAIDEVIEKGIDAGVSKK